MTDAGLAELAPWRVTYPSGEYELAGYLFRPQQPEGAGLLPAVVVNHGSGGLGPRLRGVAEALNRLGYVALLAVRRGYNANPGPNWRSIVTAPFPSEEYGRQLAAALPQENDDVIAAAAWLARQPGVDGNRLAVMGVSFGGIMTTLALARPHPFRAGVNFAGAAMNWDRVAAARALMLDAVRRVDVPLFLIQALNDYSIQPTYALGAELARLGKPHEARIYAAHGTTHQDGHGLFVTGIDTWLDDVGRFLARWG